MPASFPSLSFGQMAMYPVTRPTAFPARVLRYIDDTEQRWHRSAPLVAWLLSFQSLSPADITALRNFFNSVKGAFDSTWTFGPIDGTSYTNMAFDQDDFTIEETLPGRYSVSLRARQTIKSGSYASGLPATYPALAVPAGVVQSARFLTTRNDQDTGPRYASFPTSRASPLFHWQLNYRALTDAQAGTLIDFFASSYGMFGQFSFTDLVDGSTHTKVRFAQNVIERRYAFVGASDMTVRLMETA